MRVSVLNIALALAGLYALYCGVLFLSQRSMLFPRHQIDAAPEVRLEELRGERLWLQTGFGRVECWFLPPAAPVDEPYPAVVFAHGNAELIDDFPETYPDEFLRFLDLGMAVLLVEYPGYGRSDGSPTQETVTETFVTAYDSLVARPEVDAERVLLFGRSLGGGAVCALAAQRPSRAMILFTTFSSIRDMAGKFMAPAFLVRDPFDNLSVVRAYPGPVLVIHGTEDGLIPYEHAQRLSAAAQRGTMITYDCGHNSCPPDWEEYWLRVIDFVRHAGILK